MVPTRNQIAMVFVDVTYNYDAYEQGISDIIAHTHNKKEIGNN